MGENLNQLLGIMSALRDPQTGCPWDVKQDHKSLRKYVIEEAYEVAEAIDNGDDASLKDELGDLLLQVVFHAQIAFEAGRFDFEDIAASINEKMITRHPHVFGDAGKRNVEEQTADWERIKHMERADKGQASALDGVSQALPSLMRAQKIQKRAARVGFDWDDLAPVRAKILEELRELDEAAPKDSTEEFGDALFALVNYGRHLGIDAEEALERTNQKFLRRFAFIESELKEIGRAPENASLEEMEILWQKAKTLEPKS